MDYIRSLRQLIGHRPILLCGVAVFVINEKEQILLMHRRDNDTWGIPGGAIELGETLEEAAKRETFEETGLKITNLTLFSAYSGKEFYYKYPNEDEVYNVTIVYLTKAFNGELKADGLEGKEVAFFDQTHLPNKISPPIKPILEDFFNKYHKL